MQKYPADTTQLRDLARATPFSHDDLHETKITFHLTDFGLKQCIDAALPLGMHPYSIAYRIEELITR